MEEDIRASALIRSLVTEYLSTPDPDDEDPFAAITGIARTKSTRP
jgi:hypothetical protein